MQYAIRFVPSEHVQAVRDIFKNQGQRTTIKGRGPRSGIGEYRDCAKDKVSHFTVYVYDEARDYQSRIYFDFNGMKSGKFHMKHHHQQPPMHNVRYEGKA